MREWRACLLVCLLVCEGLGDVTTEAGEVAGGCRQALVRQAYPVLVGLVGVGRLPDLPHHRAHRLHLHPE
mgnify:CR=1 FL=1